MMRPSADGSIYARLGEKDIAETKERLADHFVNLIVDGERCAAFALH